MKEYQSRELPLYRDLYTLVLDPLPGGPVLSPLSVLPTLRVDLISEDYVEVSDHLICLD